jgi:hypothetical protein
VVFNVVQKLKDLGPDLPSLVTARAQKSGAIAHDDVSVVAASSA